ncbi:hypothetical protein DFH09DRAFT_1342579 [Mycena vulgaris]|nr:hypothetical protein DFH09DRAFT_1342579 [Mycena vulgaris]
MPSLQKLTLYNSDGIESLLTLFACASTPSIQHLHLTGFNGSLYEKLSQSQRSFDHIQQLTLRTRGWQKEVTPEEVVVMFRRLHNLQSLRMSQNNHRYLCALAACPKSLSKLTELSVRHTDLPILKLYLSQRPNPTTFKILYYADPDSQKPSEAVTLKNTHQEFDLEFKHWRWTED